MTKNRYVQIHEPDGGLPTGATFAVENVDGALTIRYDSRGTTAGTKAYRRGMVLLLQRLSEAGVTLRDAAIETKTTESLSLDRRRLPLPAPYSMPMALDVEAEKDADALRAAIHTAAARAGRAPGAKGGGNGTKRLRLYLRRHAHPGSRTRWSAEEIEEVISRGS